MPGWTVIGTPWRYAWARIEACFQRCATAIRPAGQRWSSIARSRSARAAVSGCRGSAAIAAASSSASGKRRAVFLDEPAQRPAVAQAVERAGHEREMDVRRRLVPGAEGARRHVLLDALGRGAQPGVFPVVDRAGAVGRQVRQPAAGHHPLENPGGAVAQQVGAVDQHDGRARARGRPGSSARSLRPATPTGSGHGVERSVGIDQDLVGPRQALALGQRKDLAACSGRVAVTLTDRLTSQSWPIGRDARSAAQQVIDERDGVAKIGDDGVGADAQQPLALPLVDPAGAVVRLVAGDGHGQAADLLGVLDLDVAVAEREQLPAGDPVLAGGCGR